MTKLFVLVFVVGALAAGVAGTGKADLFGYCDNPAAFNYGEFAPCVTAPQNLTLLELMEMTPYGAPDCSAITKLQTVNYGAAVQATVDAYCSADPWTMSQMQGQLCVVWDPSHPQFANSSGNCVTGGKQANNVIGPLSSNTETLDMSVTVACGPSNTPVPLAAVFSGSGTSNLGTADNMFDESTPLTLYCAWAGVVGGSIG